jgi:hypothetical protein
LSTLAIAAAVALLVAFAWRLRSSRRRRAEPADALDTVQAWPPRATRVLDGAERQAWDLLRHALPAQMILAQVPLQRFLKVPTRNSYAEWLRRVGQINADFVVCDAQSQVVAVVEIQAEDEAAGSRAQRRRERMMRVLDAAQVPVFVWRAGALPSAGAIREAILPPVQAPRLDDDPAPEAREDSAAAGREPPPSTWFDDFDSAPAPLAVMPAVAPPRARGPR